VVSLKHPRTRFLRRRLGEPRAGGHEPDRVWPVAIGTMIKNEEPYLREWLEFHLMVGVEHFYVYDNGSTDGYEAVLAPDIERGLVTLHHWPLHPDQPGAYNACLERYRRNARWIGFIDIDEFVVPSTGESIVEPLDLYLDYGAVALNWLMFSTSGHMLKPEGLVTESFTRCQAGGNRHVKVFMQPARTRRITTSHSVECIDPYFTVTVRGERLDGPYSVPPTLEPLRINHYWTKSMEEWFMQKLSRGEIDGVKHLRNAQGIIMAERDYATGDDHEIQRFVPALKERLAAGAPAATAPSG